VRRGTFAALAGDPDRGVEDACARELGRAPCFERTRQRRARSAAHDDEIQPGADAQRARHDLQLAVRQDDEGAHSDPADRHRGHRLGVEATAAHQQLRGHERVDDPGLDRLERELSGDFSPVRCDQRFRFRGCGA